jgi:hypothetical protein
MKTYVQVEVKFCAFLPSALNGAEWSDSHYGSVIPNKESPLFII